MGVSSGSGVDNTELVGVGAHLLEGAPVGSGVPFPRRARFLPPHPIRVRLVLGRHDDHRDLRLAHRFGRSWGSTTVATRNGVGVGSAATVSSDTASSAGVLTVTTGASASVVSTRTANSYRRRLNFGRGRAFGRQLLSRDLDVALVSMAECDLQSDGCRVSPSLERWCSRGSRVGRSGSESATRTAVAFRTNNIRPTPSQPIRNRNAQARQRT